MIDEKHAETIAEALRLLKICCRGIIEYYEQWLEVKSDAKAYVDEGRELAYEIKGELLNVSRAAISYHELNSQFRVVHDLLKVNAQLYYKVNGAQSLSRSCSDLSRMLKQTMEQEKELNALMQPDVIEVEAEIDDSEEEDRILSLLTQEQLAQVYAWIEENHAVSAGKN